MPDEFPKFFDEDDEERCYCRNCIGQELAEEADEYYWRVKHTEEVRCQLPDSLLEFASSDTDRASDILIGYCTAYHNYMTGVWRPVQ